MKITDEDFKGIDNYGYICRKDGRGFIIDFPFAAIQIIKRPFYCNRGRYGFYAYVKEGYNDKLNIDAADCFPRYFFNLQNLFNELHEWAEFNRERLGVENKAKQQLNKESPLESKFDKINELC